MLLADVVATSDVVAATPSRTAKTVALAELLAGLAAGEIEPTVGFLVGAPRQRRLNVGGATLYATTGPPAATSTLTIGDVDSCFEELAAQSGPGSAGRRQELLRSLFERSTDGEIDFLRRLMIGEIRHGALQGVLADAVARAAGVPLASVRRAAMLSGDLARAAVLAITGGEQALAAVGLTPLHPVQPMLASTAISVGDALDAVGGPASIEWKLDGIRIQVHRHDDEVRVFTRNLNDVTDRFPDLAARVLALDSRVFILDGELIGLHDDELPRLFQTTASSFANQDRTAHSNVALRPFFFDCLHANGVDLLDRPLHERQAVLAVVVGPMRVTTMVTADIADAAAFADGSLAAGHEGVMVKAIESRYEAGRRGKAWRKVKPVCTFDLVVLGAEWGHGRRHGWLSNLHLGARRVGPRGDDEFVMVGKTFKGLTDELLAWQTTRFQELAVADGSADVVFIRPEVVVEIALDGVQISTRYPGGIALRFARVKRYRPDKSAAEADTLETLRALLPPQG